MIGKCPGCGTQIDKVHTHPINIGDGGPHRHFKGVSYACPDCETILGVGLDPLALQNDLLEKLAERLKPN